MKNGEKLTQNNMAKDDESSMNREIMANKQKISELKKANDNLTIQVAVLVNAKDALQIEYQVQVLLFYSQTKT